MVETFCLRLAGGLVLALFVLPARAVNPRFVRIHLQITLGLTLAAGVAAWATAGDLFWAALGLAASGSLVGSWLWSDEGLAVGYACLVLALGGLICAWLCLPAASPAVSDLFWLGTLGEHLTSAALLGLATAAMLLGHWYLIAPTMSIRPLLRLLAGLFAALGLRALTAGVALGPWLAGEVPFDRVAWLWLATRWGAGMAGPLVLTGMAWQAARMRSTQSATGILYVVVIFVFLGELTDQLLQSHLREMITG
jgi:hypothetical protein